MEALDRACAVLRARPLDVEGFLALVDPFVRNEAGSWADPAEIAQRARIKIWRAAARCRADSAARLRAWLRRVVRSCGWSWRARVREAEPLDPGRADPEAGADRLAERRALGRAIERCVAAAAALDVQGLGAADRAWAVRERVSPDHDLRARNLRCLERLRVDEDRSATIASELRVGVATVKAAADRGAASVALAARALSASERDPLARSALARIAGARGLEIRAWAA